MTVPPNYGSPQPDQPPTPLKPRRWPWLLGIAAALLVGAAIGGSGGGSSSSSTASSTAARPTTSWPVPDTTKPTPAAPAAAAEPDLSAGIPEGEWSVPDQVKPGQYRSTGAKQGIFELCSATTRDAAGNVLDWKTANAGEQVLITVSSKAATFSNTGCETFVKR